MHATKSTQHCLGYQLPHNKEIPKPLRKHQAFIILVTGDWKSWKVLQGSNTFKFIFVKLMRGWIRDSSSSLECLQNLFVWLPAESFCSLLFVPPRTGTGGPGMSNEKREKGRGRETGKDRNTMGFIVQSWKWQRSLLLSSVICINSSWFLVEHSHKQVWVLVRRNHAWSMWFFE